MLLTFEQRENQSDIEVLVTYPKKDKLVERIRSLLESADTQIQCFSERGAGHIQLVNVSDIYYIESVDRKTIVSCGDTQYQVKERLYQIYEKLIPYGFVQISKYCIVNSNKLHEIIPLSNSHLDAVLTNGMRLYVTRKYLAAIRRILQETE
jgi:DNA-binding LytR/AlgR family response regulator